MRALQWKSVKWRELMCVIILAQRWFCYYHQTIIVCAPILGGGIFYCGWSASQAVRVYCCEKIWCKIKNVTLSKAELNYLKNDLSWKLKAKFDTVLVLHKSIYSILTFHDSSNFLVQLLKHEKNPNNLWLLKVQMCWFESHNNYWERYCLNVIKNKWHEHVYMSE